MNRRQTIPKELRYTITDFNNSFPDEEACFVRIAEMRFPQGMTYCPECKRERKHHRVTGRTAYACDSCGHHAYPLANTIFQKTTTPLRLWFYAMYLMASTRCGISAKQIQRETGVTYKTAWRMFKQIRLLLAEEIKLEGSSIEADEAFYGGRRKNSKGRTMRGDRKMAPIFGMVERGGRVIAKATKDTKSATLFPIIREFVLPKSTIFTDEYQGYGGIKNMTNKYEHRRINHSAGVFVAGDVHTQTIEGFWSLVKRGLSGVYHSVSQKYLQSYLDEYSYRFNRRASGNLIFWDVLKQAGKVLPVPSDPEAEKKTPEIQVPF
jgi:transposase